MGVIAANFLNNENEALFSVPMTDWSRCDNQAEKDGATHALEHGQIVYLPQLSFMLTDHEKTYLRDSAVAPDTKSVKYSPATQKIWGVCGEPDAPEVLSDMMQRYADAAQDLVRALLPSYADHASRGNTSFRPVEAEGRVQSKRQDDQRLHIDAFPSRPSGGKRILRIFSNINPNGQSRQWQAGDDFSNVAAHFMPRIAAPFPFSAAVMKTLGITKTARTAYDHYMMHIHDMMKLDDAYQQNARRTPIAFAPGSTWIVFTDQVSHAAISGQHVMEQTFSVPQTALQDQDASPLRVLETLKGRTLA